jgi:heat shock protein HslJ
VALPGSQWILAELAGESVTAVGERGPGYLRFEAGTDRFGASVGCNSLAGKWTSDGASVTFSETISTMMACAEPLMTRERQLADALTRSTTYRVRDGRLELLAGDDVLAAFVAGGAE